MQNFPELWKIILQLILPEVQFVKLTPNYISNGYAMEKKVLYFDNVPKIIVKYKFLEISTVFVALVLWGIWCSMVELGNMMYLYFIVLYL